MFLDRLKKNKEKLKKLGHAFASFVILMHAYERFESGHSSYLFFTIFGIIFLSVAIFHHQLLKKFPWVDAVFFIIEGILSLIIAYEFFHVGKKIIPFLYLVSAFFQFFMVVKSGKMGLKKYNQHQ